MKQIYETVKETTNEMDYMDLLASQAPKDEFEPEIRKICVELTTDHSIEEIAGLLAKIFNASFNENDISDMFLEYAQKIKTKLDNSPSVS